MGRGKTPAGEKPACPAPKDRSFGTADGVTIDGWAISESATSSVSTRVNSHRTPWHPFSAGCGWAGWSPWSSWWSQGQECSAVGGLASVSAWAACPWCKQHPNIRCMNTDPKASWKRKRCTKTSARDTDTIFNTISTILGLSNPPAGDMYRPRDSLSDPFRPARAYLPQRLVVTRFIGSKPPDPPGRGHECGHCQRARTPLV